MGGHSLGQKELRVRDVGSLDVRHKQSEVSSEMEKGHSAPWHGVGLLGPQFLIDSGIFSRVCVRECACVHA